MNPVYNLMPWFFKIKHIIFPRLSLANSIFPQIFGLTLSINFSSPLPDECCMSLIHFTCLNKEVYICISLYTLNCLIHIAQGLRPSPSNESNVVGVPQTFHARTETDQISKYCVILDSKLWTNSRHSSLLSVIYHPRSPLELISSYYLAGYSA
jgi:hypothetical protein